MKTCGPFILLSVLGISGCPTRDKYDQKPIVTITAPTTITYTNGIVEIAVATSPFLDLPIVLRRNDGVDLATLTPPTFTSQWNTATVPEGPYTITAEVAFTNETIRSSPVTIVVDRKPPTVSLTPAAGSTDVRLRSPIRAEFSEPVVFASPASSTFSLSADGSAVPTTVTISPDGMNATIAIDDLTSISLPGQLGVAITGTITDRAGNVLPNPAAWSWSVPAWITLPTTLRSAVPPVMTLGRDERPVIGYAVPDAMGVSSIAVARYDGSRWAPLPNASGSGDSARAGISVAVDADDTTFVAWSDYATGSRFIFVRRWNGATWEAPLPVLDGVAGTGTDAVAPNIRFDRTDRLVASWIENGDVFVARSSGSTWDQSWGSLGLSMANAADLVLDAQDNPVVAWRMKVSDQGISTWNGAWTTTALPGSVQPPTVATDSMQLPLTAITDSQRVLLLRIANREATNAGEILTTAAQNPRIVTDRAGKPAIAWLRTIERRLAFARWTGSTWDQRAGVFDDGSSTLGDGLSPQVAIDSTGTVWIAWLENGVVNVRMTNY